MQQGSADAGGIGAGLVHLVDGHDHRHAGRLGVLNGFDGLRHDAVVPRHHEHHDIGDAGTTGAHRSEGLVTGRVEEGDLLLVLGGHLIGADMLGDATGLALHHVGPAQRIEQAGLAVIDMAHDGDDRRTERQILVDIDFADHALFDVAFRNTHDVVAEFGQHQFGGVLIDFVNGG